VRVEALSDGTSVPPGALLDLTTRLNARVALCEGGPHLFGEMLRARLIDELFLTVGPQVIGRDPATHRLGLVEGTTFGTGRGRWAGLVSVRRAGDDLFLRYRFEG
jgi:riboflavin biosynthesis pyrimidine reductase